MSHILTEIKNGVGIITLNRPEKFNSFNKEMAFAMQDAIDAFEENAAVRCIYITGSGKAFCAGQDIGELLGDDAPGFDTILRKHYNPIAARIRSIGKPFVAAVNGVAAGAGANLALCCDIAVATESASFIQAFSKIGLIPDTGGTFMLPRLIGFQKATALMMLGDKVSATDAEKIGMIFKVFPDENFAEESFKIAETLAQMPTKGLAYTKRALNNSCVNDFQSQLKVEDDLQYKAAQTQDFKEGMNAFLEKRAPKFIGK